jgi:hypothetical protein
MEPLHPKGPLMSQILACFAGKRRVHRQGEANGVGLRRILIGAKKMAPNVKISPLAKSTASASTTH